MNTVDLIKLAEMGAAPEDMQNVQGDGNEVTAAMMKELLAEAEGLPAAESGDMNPEDIDPEVLQALMSMSQGGSQEMPEEAGMGGEEEINPEILQMIMSALGGSDEGSMAQGFEGEEQEDSSEYTEDSTGVDEDDIAKEAMVKASAFLKSAGLL